MSPQNITSFNISSLPLFTPELMGESSNSLRTFKGIVHEKNETGEKFISYKIADKKDPEDVYKVLCFKKDCLSVDNMSFLEMHEDVEEGDLVSVQGFAARSKKGTPYIRATGITVKEYGNNEYETTDHEESDIEDVADDESVCSDPDYAPSESSEEEELEHNLPIDNYQPTLKELSEVHMSFPNIPMTVFKDFIEYQGRFFKIDFIHTNIPFKIVLGTALGNFHFTKLDSKFMGILVPGNALEPDYQFGYDLIFPGKFHNLLHTLI
jgi:hypothetical protein